MIAAGPTALGRGGSPRRLALDIEGHGRDALGEALDRPTRTVGWFTEITPVAFELSAPAAAKFDPPRPATRLGVSRRRRAGHRGLGALRCLPRDAALRERAEAVPDPAIAFNYLGELRGRGAASVSVPLPGSSTRTKRPWVPLDFGPRSDSGSSSAAVRLGRTTSRGPTGIGNQRHGVDEIDEAFGVGRGELPGGIDVVIDVDQRDVADLAEDRLLGGGREFFEFGAGGGQFGGALAGELADEVEDDAGVHVGGFAVERTRCRP